MSLSESQSVSENGENRKIPQHDRNLRYCREHSHKLHTNENCMPASAYGLKAISDWLKFIILQLHLTKLKLVSKVVENS